MVGGGFGVWLRCFGFWGCVVWVLGLCWLLIVGLLVLWVCVVGAVVYWFTAFSGSGAVVGFGGGCLLFVWVSYLTSSRLGLGGLDLVN